MGPERNEIQLLSNTAAKGSGLFGNIRNILEISCKFLLNFECSISEIHEILRFLETKLCYIEATRLQLLLSW